jgi:hypothetical protein
LGLLYQVRFLKQALDDDGDLGAGDEIAGASRPYLQGRGPFDAGGGAVAA